MKEIVMSVENLSKQYRLGQVGTGTISHDLKRWWYRIRGKDDPYLKIGDENDRTKLGGDYVWALRDINFDVEKGQVLGVIGKNGAGKSTLLKILSQVTLPTEGSVKVNGRIASLLEVGTGFHPELTGRENIFLNGAILGMTKVEIKDKFDEIVDFSGCAKFIDTPVKRYSSGMMVRLGFAVAAHLEPEILIIDEVLAVGDQEFQDKCIGKMKDVASGGRTVLFVSHNMASIKSLCSESILMDKGTVVAKGPTEEIISRYRTEIEDRTFDGISEVKPVESKGINSVHMFNTEGDCTGEYHYREPIVAEIAFNLPSEVNNINVDARIVSSDGIVFSHASTLYLPEPINLDEGRHVITLQLENDLVPGVYSLDLGLHFPDYNTIDYVPGAISFRVDNSNPKTKDTYYFRWSNKGYTLPKTRWEIKTAVSAKSD